MARRSIPETDSIVVIGASEHNLQNIDITLPRDTLTVFTGVSGSGKSSLAFDTLFKEGQRRFLESLSPYARQFLGQMEKPKVEHVEGLSPTVSIDQKTVNRNPRSTVGTITELYDHYRLLMARLGQPHCPDCGVPISTLTADQITERMLIRWGERDPGADTTGIADGISNGKSVSRGRKSHTPPLEGGTPSDEAACLVLAPMVRERKGEYRAELTRWHEQGFLRARIDGQVRRLDETITLVRYEKHTLELVLDRLTLAPRNRSRLTEAVEKALELSGGLVTLSVQGEEHLFSSTMACPKCQTPIPELEPRLFSFNDPQGACPKCHGLGLEHRFVETRLTDPARSLAEGTLTCFTAKGNLVFTDMDRDFMVQLARALKIDPRTPWGKLPAAQRALFLEGNGGPEPRVRSVFRDPELLLREARSSGLWPGLYAVLGFIGHFVGGALDRYRDISECPVCQGQRLNPVALAVRFREHNIHTLSRMSIEEAVAFYNALELTATEDLIGRDIFREIKARLSFLNDVGVGYLTLERGATTLSGGEAQRIRLAAQVGSGLQGVLYILDEPSIGLHQTDNRKLIQTLRRLRDTGNTVYVVEHDQETIASADHVVDLGPGAGSQGGHVLAQGSVAQVMAAKDSLSGRYLSGEMTIAIPKQRRIPGKAAITIHGARRNNLQNLTVRLPLGVFVAVTGVSGSGKSTLVHDLLKPALSRYLDTPGAGDAKGTVTGSRTGDFSRITGLQHLDKVIEIDQTPIGRTPRSNPATYTKVLDPIRELFTQVPEARIRGYKPGRFSFNVKGGRCETCEGAGIRTIEMQFLSDVEVVCEDCQGRRFNEETLGIHYKGRSIHDVLEMSVDQASEFFAPVPAIAHILNTLQNVGLGYIKLGQPSTTLSGGEAQRMKLASELRKRGTGRTLYLLDEPTTGLHFHDIRTLLNCLNILVEQGNTVLVIEHNLDVIKVADWLIDLGPGGGKHGGRLVAQGTPEDLAALTGTPTGSVLAEVLQPQALPAGTRAAPTRPPRHDVMVYGAAQHNLKHLEVRIPRNRLTVVTGVSGSGKTSLAFDTLFAEGQARYVESLSTYARRFLGRMDKARVDRIEGLAPAIAIDQKNSGRSPRSTVATVTEIYDYLRLLYARIGTPHCPHCGQPLEGHTPSRLARLLVESRPGERVILLAPLYRPDSTRPTMLDDPAHLPQLARALRTEGFNRLHLGGAPVELEDYLAKLSPQAASTRGSTKTTLKATAKTAATPKPKRGRKGASSGALAVDLVLDRTRITPGDAKRLAEALETGFEKGHGLVRLVFPDAASTAPVATSNTRTGAESDRSAGEWLVSRQLGCVACDYYQEEELTPRMFSFNSHVGACETCSGLGQSPQVDPERLVAFPQFPLLKGALVPGKLEKTLTRASSASERIVRAFAQREGIDVDLPFRKLSPEAQDLLLYGDGQRLNFTRRRAFSRGMRPASTTFKGLVGMVMALHEGEHREEWREHTSLVMADVPCRACGGERLKAAYRAVTLNGRSISNYCQLTVEQALADLGTWPLSAAARQVADQPFQEIRSRLGFLKDVGLGYLSLNREATTLSGGEAQRIRLASQLGAHLVGVLYVLDEPTIGLHPRDTGRLLDTLRRLRDLGNTVVVVEHDPETIRAADHVLDIGPGAGHLGGEVVAEGTPAQVKANIRSLTGAYLSGRKHIPIPQQIRTADPARTLHLKGARANNLKNVDAVFPLGLLTCVTGVSGSGKSSLVVSVLQRALEQRLTSARVMPGAHDALMGVAHLDSLVVIDQSPIGRSPKSNPATYTGVMDRIRALMAATRMARERGYTPGRFSFNVAGGRCEACEGRGFNHIEMHFLADVWVPCDVCAGKRYNRETLEVLFRGKSIAEILDLEIAQALELFEYQPVPRRALQTVVDVGLGYMKLGQAANTLSGGEAQRLKLAAELSRPATGRTVYILDEPTTGLHMDDTAKLLMVLHRLADQGNTVIVIEHNLDVIKTADRVIDLGPEGGEAGGHIIGIGTPAELTHLPGSHTGRALAPLFSC